VNRFRRLGLDPAGVGYLKQRALQENSHGGSTSTPV